MPRDGSGQYTQPEPNVAAGTTIESAVYNHFTQDVAADLNWPRPIIAGGTGASSAAAAREALGVPTSLQTVTNYDSHVWQQGAFWSAAGGATGAPSANMIAGTCVVSNNDPNNILLEARDIVTGLGYVRIKSGGTWGAWTTGVKFLSYNAGTFASGTLTPDASNGNYWYYTNNGAHSIAVPPADSALDILSTNGAGAGAIGFPGYTVGINTGDLHTTTSGHRFIFSIRRIAGVSTYVIKALQ
jgi:hypothetical protein